MQINDIERVIDHLQAALSILQRDDPSSSTRSPEWFRDTGHLSDKGIEHLHSLFEKGTSIYRAAKAMDISYRAASLRHADWKKKKGI